MTFEEAKHQFDNVKAPDVYFHVPDFWGNMVLMNFLAHYMKKDPYMFYPGTKIGAVYGIFPGCIWNGGTLSAGGNVEYEIMKDTINHYNKDLHLPITFTFTNPCIKTMQQCEDIYANTMAELGHNGMNYINVSSPILAEYLKKNYPKYHYCRSIVASKDQAWDLDGWEISVLQRAWNNQWDLLNSIPEDKRGQIEILVNDPCPDTCPRIYEHYISLGEAQLLNSFKDQKTNCSFGPEFIRTKMQLENKTFINRKMLEEEYIPAGFRNFKFSGRMCLIRATMGALDYMIHPYYHEDVLMALFCNYNPNPIPSIYEWDKDAWTA